MDFKAELAGIKDRTRGLVKAINPQMKGFGALSAAARLCSNAHMSTVMSA